MRNIITIKLTKREAEVTFHSLGMHSQDYVDNWDEDMQQIMGGKRYYNLLRSASRKIWIAKNEKS